MEKECKKHGLTDYSPRKNGGYRCRKCQGEATSRRRKKLKEMAIEYKGGCCSKCGYNKCSSALEFHHLDPSKKEFGVMAGGFTRAWDKIKKELDKCILVCANCHREIHEGIK